MFQSTPPHGGRPYSGNKTIHRHKFQSTPPHGGRHPIARQCLKLAWFQSTPPHGGRPPGRSWQGLFCFGFNPRPRMGGDGVKPSATYSRHVSIHAPAWGATVEPGRRTRLSTGFNPRPRMGGDLLHLPLLLLMVCFNPRPRMGGDDITDHSARGCVSFNPRPRMGGDP